MWAKVESDSVTKVYTRPTALTIGDVNYPQNIMQMWSASELETIGIYEITIDNTNLKENEYYTNGAEVFTFASDTVTKSYGTATAKSLTDVLFTAADESNGLGTEGEVHIKGLKTLHKESINREAYSNLRDSDWLVIRAAEGGTAVTSAWTTYRAAVRTKANEHQAAIDAVANVDALAALTFDWPTEP